MLFTVKLVTGVINPPEEIENAFDHGLRTPNEGINQKYLKIGPMW